MRERLKSYCDQKTKNDFCYTGVEIKTSHGLFILLSVKPYKKSPGFRSSRANRGFFIMIRAYSGFSPLPPPPGGFTLGLSLSILALLPAPQRERVSENWTIVSFHVIFFQTVKKRNYVGKKRSH